MLEPEIKTRLLRAVDDHFEDQFDFTGELVRFPSTREREHTA